MALFKTKDITAVPADQLESHQDEFFEKTVICKSPGKLEHLVKLIAPGTAVHYLSRGDWSMHDLVISLLNTYRPAELFITTFALREMGVRQLLLAQDAGDLSAVNMVLDYRAEVRTPEVFQLANNNFNKIALHAIHAKVTVIKSDAGIISIVGSANWTTNPKIECGVVTMNAAVGIFHIEWITKLINDAELFK